ncbi:MAG: nitrophenyl compound nitroreductase subunit ArsF family protein [Bacteroidales bacterium]
MKTLKLLVILFSVVLTTSCNAQGGSKNTTALTSGNIEVYYFHFTARCVTCKTVEAEAQKNIETLYAEQLKSGKISFQSINLDDDSSKAIAEKLGISGQTLLIVCGDQKINITNDGFMNARSNPDKFKQIMKEKIDKLL